MSYFFSSSSRLIPRFRVEMEKFIFFWKKILKVKKTSARTLFLCLSMLKTSPVNSWLNSIPKLCKTTYGNINLRLFSISWRPWTILDLNEIKNDFLAEVFWWPKMCKCVLFNVRMKICVFCKLHIAILLRKYCQDWQDFIWPT